jgi:phenylacetate-CoA ligase
MKFINLLQKNIVLPAFDLVSGQSISRSLDFLLESQNWSAEELISFQEESLQKLIRHAYENVPFYKDLFDDHHLVPSDIQTISDLKKLPLISKDDLRKHPVQYYLARNIPAGKLISVNSSGSTGEPFRYFLSVNAYSMKYAAALRGWMWMGYSLGDHYAKLSQNRRSSLIKRTQDFINRCTYLYISDLTEQSLLNIVKILEHTKPLFVRCYPDPLFFIAKALKKNGIKLKGIKAINSTGNILTPEARENIEIYFNCPVYDSYSCEGGALYYESPGHDKYLGSMEYAITEIIDKNGIDVTPGEAGMHVTTDIQNYGMPMIRYNTQDLVERSIDSNSGLQLNGLKKIIGRDNDILVTPEGNLLIVHLFTIYFEYFPSIKQFQVEQLQSHEFIFRLVADENFNEKTRRQIYDYWQNILGKNVKLTIEVLVHIPVLYSGKRRFLIRNPEIKLFI